KLLQLIYRKVEQLVSLTNKPDRVLRVLVRIVLSFSEFCEFPSFDSHRFVFFPSFPSFGSHRFVFFPSFPSFLSFGSDRFLFISPSFPSFGSDHFVFLLLRVFRACRVLVRIALSF